MRKIYAIKDNNDIFYIGQSANPKLRLTSHICESKNFKNDKDRKIQDAIKNNRNISYEILHECADDENVNLKERETILYYKSEGFNILNGTLPPTEKEKWYFDKRPPTMQSHLLITDLDKKTITKLKRLAYKDNRKLAAYIRIQLQTIVDSEIASA